MNTHQPYIDLLSAWKTNNRVTEFFIENIPDNLWSMKIPGTQRKTIQMVAGHIHNTRCMWLKMIGKNHKIKIPKSVDRRTVTQSDLLKALKSSNQGIVDLFKVGIRSEGILNLKFPWNNLPSDIFHFLTYMVAHEAHHRGQIILAARQLGKRLPQSITNGIWQWKKRHKESLNS